MRTKIGENTPARLSERFSFAYSGSEFSDIREREITDRIVVVAVAAQTPLINSVPINRSVADVVLLWFIFYLTYMYSTIFLLDRLLLISLPKSLRTKVRGIMWMLSSYIAIVFSENSSCWRQFS